MALVKQIISNSTNLRLSETRNKVENFENLIKEIVGLTISSIIDTQNKHYLMENLEKEIFNPLFQHLVISKIKLKILRT